MRRIIFCNLVMVISLATATSLRYRPQIPLLDLHHMQVGRADRQYKQAEVTLDELVGEEEEEEDLEEMTYEEATGEETVTVETTTTTEAPTKEVLKRKRRPPRKKRVLRKRTTKSQNKHKPVCGAEPLYGLEMSCEQPTTCKPIIGDIDGREVKTTCNTIPIPTKELITVSFHSAALRHKLSSQKKIEGNERAQHPIRQEVKIQQIRKQTVKERRRPPRRPMHIKKRKPRLRQDPYVGKLSSTSTFAPFPNGFHPTYPKTPYENYHCGLIANCVENDWGTEIRSTTTERPSTSSTTEIMGRTGTGDSGVEEEDDYVLSDYQFE